MTQAEEAVKESQERVFQVKDLIDGWGAGWNPKTSRWTFPDGSTGVFDEKHSIKYTRSVRNIRTGLVEVVGAAYYPFKLLSAPLQFPDAENDKSVNVTPVVRNARGEALRPVLDSDPPPEYIGDHSPAVETGRDGAVVKRKVHKLTKEPDEE